MNTKKLRKKLQEEENVKLAHKWRLKQAENLLARPEFTKGADGNYHPTSSRRGLTVKESIHRDSAGRREGESVTRREPPD